MATGMSEILGHASEPSICFPVGEGSALLLALLSNVAARYSCTS